MPAPVVPAQPLGARTFTAPAGLMFNTVRPDRVVDFEMVMGYLQAALEKSTDAEVREQAKGWRVFKATEPGPNSTVLYVFVIDPAVPGADYGLGRILADAYPDQIQEIWKLYTGSVARGGDTAESVAGDADAADRRRPPPVPAAADRRRAAPPVDCSRTGPAVSRLRTPGSRRRRCGARPSAAARRAA